MPRTRPKPLQPPARVRVGHRYYAIRFLPEVLADDGDRCDGLCVWAPAEIRLCDSLDPTALAETFLHEALHALHQESGLTDDSDEEAFTLHDAKSLCRLWQDNPAAMRWWLSLLRAPALPAPH